MRRAADIGRSSINKLVVRMRIQSFVGFEARSCRGHRLVAVAAILLGLVAAGIVQGQPAAGLDSSGGLCQVLVLPLGYPCNEYTVQTQDGFLLGVQNIPHGVEGQNSSAGTVFLQHGLFAGGDNWLFNGASESLGFILADAGYNVWIGNIRCIEWSKGHISLTPADVEFWDWSWDELAAYDLPAMLGFVHNQTQSKITYIGHSQGTSTLMASLVGTDQSQALTNMLAGAVLVCPIVFFENSSTFIQTFMDLYNPIYDVIGNQDFDPTKYIELSGEGLLINTVISDLIQETCGSPGVNCTDLYRAVTGNWCCLNYTRVPVYLEYFPQPTSSKNVEHFSQMVSKQTFSMFDYGIIGNLENYGQVTPPVYDVTKFPDSVPLMTISGGQDTLATPEDVQYLINLMGSTITTTFSLENYSHGDFVASTTANVDVYPQIISFLQQHSS